MISRPAERLTAAAKELLELGRVDLARKLAGFALSEDDSCANAHSVLAVVHEAFAEWREGQEHGRRAVDLMPGSPQLRYNLALSTLRLDDYRAGFSLMEARIDKPDWTGLAIAPSRAAERHCLLRPEDLVEGRRILVITRRGLAIASCSRATSRCSRREAQITVACSPPLRPIFERVTGIDEILSPPPEQPLGKINLSIANFDVWVPLLSLPVYFGTQFTTVPADVPYLSIDPSRVAGLASTLRGERPIGYAQDRPRVSGEPGERLCIGPLTGNG